MFCRSLHGTDATILCTRAKGDSVFPGCQAQPKGGTWIRQVASSRVRIGFRHLSPSIVLKRNYLAVDLTVSSLYA
jgi:hypothetical protein